MPILTAEALCARAVIAIGASPIQAFDEGTAEAIVAEAFYEITRDQLLAAHPWNFATSTANLARLAEPPDTDFAFAFHLPEGVVRILSVGRAGFERGIVYRRRGSVIETDADAVTLRYIETPPEEVYPAWFQAALIAALAEAFALPLTESTARWGELSRAAERTLARARLIDAQEDTPDAVPMDALTVVR
jgi:hypothetical protein